jgi:hypothetical protein
MARRLLSSIALSFVELPLSFERIMSRSSVSLMHSSRLNSSRWIHTRRMSICHAVDGLKRIRAESSVEEALEVGSSLLGKRLPDTVHSLLIEKLSANWYVNAQDIADMSDEESLSMGVPLRLKSMIAKAIQQDEDEETQDETTLWENTMYTAASASAAVSTAEDSMASMEERVCPPLNRFGNGVVSAPKVVKRAKITKYSLSKNELTPGLVQEFEQLFKFGTERFYGAQAEPIAAVTAEKYADHVRGMLGYLVNIQGEPMETMSLKALVPSVGRDGVIPAFNYVQWLVKERQIAVRTELLVLRAILYVAKFVHHDASHIVPGSGEKTYSDLDVVKELRALINSRRKASKVAPRVADEKAKWIDWEEYLMIVSELRKETGALLPDGSRRGNKDIAWSLQKYLIFAILSCIPDRQRTIRELKIDRTLFKESGNQYVIRHRPEDYKTGKSYGERAPLFISESITADVDLFLGTYRQYLEPEHDFLFTQANGQPLTDKSLYKLFWTTCYRITGKRLSPHMVRDVVITHLRGTNASERELEALAIYMGHSVTIQKSTYDRRSKQDKVQPAVNLLESLNKKQQ